MNYSAAIGGTAGYVAGSWGTKIQRRLRKMSKVPRENRIFDQKKLLLGTGIPMSILGTIIIPAYVNDYLMAPQRDILNLIWPSIAPLLAYSFVVRGLWRRLGVDQDKVWSKFGKLFYREIRFDEVTKLTVGNDYYRLYSNRTQLVIAYNLFDYVLLNIRLLETLQHRRFQIKDITIDDPRWEETAQIWRNIFYSDIIEEHPEYYAEHPEEAEYLKSLTQPPTHYDN